MPTLCNLWLRSIQPTQPPPTTYLWQKAGYLRTWQHTRVLLEQKNSDICSGVVGYISSEEIFSFSNDKDPRPYNFLFQIARASGATLSECTFSKKKCTSLRRLIQEKTTSRLLFERTRTRLVSPSEARETRRLSSLTVKRSRACRCGTHRFPSDMTTSRGLWPSPRTKAWRGVATATLNPSRIGQTSRTPIGKYLLYLD
jgi:hypothetical protein